MSYKKEDYVDEFSIQSVGSFDYSFPDLLCRSAWRVGIWVFSPRAYTDPSTSMAR